MKAILKDEKMEVTFTGGDFQTNLNRVKTLPGRKWNGENKSWVVPVTSYNIRQLNTWGFEVDDKIIASISNKKEERIAIPDGLNDKLFKFQRTGVQVLLQHRRILLADEMGCIDGEAILKINRCGKGFKIKLADAFKRFHGKAKKNYNWSKKNKTFARCLNQEENRIGLNEIKNIIYKGPKYIQTVVTESGKHIKLTPDHELLTETGWIETQNLNAGDYIYVNGTNICKECGSTENIIKYKYAKFYGYCKKCMYLKLRKNHKQIYETKKKGSDGYIYLRGKKYHNHPKYTSGGLLEHIYIIEEYIQMYIPDHLEVHHKNKIRDDNRIENLILVSKSRHAKLHKTEAHFKNYTHRNGSEIITIPKLEKIIHIERINEEIDVYDVVMADPDRNFIANSIIVHNCGKTIQVAAYLKIRKDRPAIIVVPASLKLNWQRELDKWTEENSQIINGKTPVEFTEKIIIINYDILQAHLENIIKMKPEILIIDEAHKIKNEKAKRTKAIKELGKHTKNIIALTGTPIINRPIEIFSTLNLIRKDLFPSKWKFAERYCDLKNNGYGWDMSGSCNMAELHTVLTEENIMLRRIKGNVLQDLPAKIRGIIPIELSKEDMADYENAETDIIKYLNDSGEEEKAKSAALAETLVRIEHLKQLAAEFKLSKCIDWIENFLESDEKLVVFCTHKKMIKKLKDHFKNICVTLDGSTSQDNRQKAVDDFQNNSDIKLFVGNLQAAGVGITLTAASNVCFLELGWTPGDHDQGEDRCHRISQKDTVNVYYLVANGTIEEEIAELLDEKRKVINAIIDGKDVEDSSLLKSLIAKYKKGGALYEGI